MASAPTGVPGTRRCPASRRAVRNSRRVVSPRWSAPGTILRLAPSPGGEEVDLPVRPQAPAPDEAIGLLIEQMARDHTEPDEELRARGLRSRNAGEPS